MAAAADGPTSFEAVDHLKQILALSEADERESFDVFFNDFLDNLENSPVETKVEVLEFLEGYDTEKSFLTETGFYHLRTACLLTFTEDEAENHLIDEEPEHEKNKWIAELISTHKFQVYPEFWVDAAEEFKEVELSDEKSPESEVALKNKKVKFDPKSKTKKTEKKEKEKKKGKGKDKAVTKQTVDTTLGAEEKKSDPDPEPSDPTETATKRGFSRFSIFGRSEKPAEGPPRKTRTAGKKMNPNLLGDSVHKGVVTISGLRKVAEFEPLSMKILQQAVNENPDLESYFNESMFKGYNPLVMRAKLLESWTQEELIRAITAYLQMNGGFNERKLGKRDTTLRDFFREKKVKGRVGTGDSDTITLSRIASAFPGMVLAARAVAINSGVEINTLGFTTEMHKLFADTALTSFNKSIDKVFARMVYLKAAKLSKSSLVVAKQFAESIPECDPVMSAEVEEVIKTFKLERLVKDNALRPGDEEVEDKEVEDAYKAAETKKRKIV
eukprot:CAMPEP_0185746128 /NCGR_PEP_ID=MMETSP1174-20130828/4560_1 /TAXON_ID=35687 /ORGANISM="Dictyocha speculum, Strain CCMP1381" /LENGTH=498 /DNA_ID=CAMNT_0028420543 /DNA_START=51 /DNA_END=1547 /DNA_ORIENTATION=+